MPPGAEPDEVAKHVKQRPAWLLGLIIAVLVFALVLVVFAILGFGDDPVIESVTGVFG